MKRELFVILFSIMAVGSYAQLSLGVNGGPAVSNLSSAYESTPHVGYKAGISAQYMFTSQWGLQTGLYVTEVGIANSHGYIPVKDINSYPGTVALQLQPRYVELPLAAVFKLLVDENVKVGASLGVYFAYGYSGKGRMRFEGLQSEAGLHVFEESTMNDGHYLDNYAWKKGNEIDYGINSSLFVDVYNFTISANYGLGLSNVYDHFPIMLDHPGYKNVRNRVAWVGIGYKFYLGKKK